jgi:hypothetical protein
MPYCNYDGLTIFIESHAIDPHLPGATASERDQIALRETSTVIKANIPNLMGDVQSKFRTLRRQQVRFATIGAAERNLVPFGAAELQAKTFIVTDIPTTV